MGRGDMGHGLEFFFLHYLQRQKNQSTLNSYINLVRKCVRCVTLCVPPPVCCVILLVRKCVRSLYYIVRPSPPPVCCVMLLVRKCVRSLVYIVRPLLCAVLCF